MKLFKKPYSLDDISLESKPTWLKKRETIKPAFNSQQCKHNIGNKISNILPYNNVNNIYPSDIDELAEAINFSRRNTQLLIDGKVSLTLQEVLLIEHVLDTDFRRFYHQSLREKLYTRYYNFVRKIFK